MRHGDKKLIEPAIIAERLLGRHAHHHRLRRGGRRHRDLIGVAEIGDGLDLRLVGHQHEGIGAQGGKPGDVLMPLGLLPGDQQAWRAEGADVDIAGQHGIGDGRRAGEALHGDLQIRQAGFLRLDGKEALRVGHHHRQIDQAVLDADADFVDLGARRRRRGRKQRAGGEERAGERAQERAHVSGFRHRQNPFSPRGPVTLPIWRCRAASAGPGGRPRCRCAPARR